MRSLIWIGAGVAALYLLSRYSFGQKTTFFLRRVRPGGSITAPTVNVELAVQNPTNQTATIKSITGSLSINGNAIANLAAFGDQKIAANSESILKLTARPSAVGVFQTVKQLFTSAPGTISANFTGSANVDGLVVPINETQTV